MNDTTLHDEREYTPEEGRLLYEFFDLLNQIAERCEAEGRPVIPTIKSEGEGASPE